MAVANTLPGGSRALSPDLTYNPLDENGNLKSQYQLQDATGITNALMAQQGQQQAAAQDQSAAQSQGALTNAQASLRGTGGLNNSNRANLVRQNMHDSLMASQGVANAGLTNKGNIGLQGAQMNQAANQQNIANTLQSVGAVNTANLNEYNQQQAVGAANEQAKATLAASNNSGSWVCTEVHNRNPLDKKEAFALFKLRRYALKRDESMSQFYLYDCKTLVENMLSKDADWNDCKSFVKNVVRLVNDGDLEGAFIYYTAGIVQEIKKFWPECSNEQFIKAKEMVGA